jgi:copper homeostasis protein CutC
LIRRSQGRIEILPAAGIDPETAMEVVQNTCCNQVHASLRSGGKRAEPVDPGTEISCGGTRTDGDAVVSMRRFLG